MNNKCLNCYLPLESNQDDYHPKCGNKIFQSKEIPTLNVNKSDLRELAKRSLNQSISITGVQPKLSLGLSKSRLTILDALDGNYILKPPFDTYPQMPENEHLSMKLAELFGIETVPFGMIRLLSGELCYITQRVDRNNDGSKNHMIDFLQIFELDDKYKGSMERLGLKIGELSSQLLFDRYRFFELTVFNYLIGNNDMHLKNFSMLLTNRGWVLAPAYDLLNVNLVLPKEQDEMALNFGGKKFNFNIKYFNRFGAGLNLNDKQMLNVYKKTSRWISPALELIELSFLKSDFKKSYKSLITTRQKMFAVSSIEA